MRRHSKRQNWKSQLNRNAFKEEKKEPQNALLQFQFSEKYKTEICKNFEQTKFCKFGNNCCFAHGDAELRTKLVSNEFYKTKTCRHFEQTGFCPYGQRCQYFHFQTNRVYGEILESLISKVNSSKFGLAGSFDEILMKTDNLWDKKTSAFDMLSTNLSSWRNAQGVGDSWNVLWDNFIYLNFYLNLRNWSF